MTKRKRKSKKSLDSLEAIKRLLMLNAILTGANSKDIAKVIGVTERRVRQLIPIKGRKKKKSHGE